MISFVLAGLALIGIALCFCLVSSYFDLRTGEIPDKFTIGLVVAALAFRAVVALVNGQLDYLWDGALTGAIYFGFGALMFYTGGWGGGDAKLLAGIGASLGGFFPALSVVKPALAFPAFTGFLVTMAFVSIPYSLLYSFILAMQKREAFSLMRKRFKEEMPVVVILAALSAVMIITLRPWTFFLAFAMLLPFIFYVMFVYIKAVEQVALRRRVDVSGLKEGDMVAEDVVSGGKVIASHRDMDGVSEEALAKLKRLAKERKIPKTIMIKWGIKFVPVFPIALVLAPFWTEILELMI